MSPAPSREHQFILRQLLLKIGNFLEHKSCEVYIAPFDVRFPEGSQEDKDIETVVQPDIVVICDKTKIDEKGAKGAPDFIVEITSPATVNKQRNSIQAVS
jgi:Uma2 family endonuclease